MAEQATSTMLPSPGRPTRRTSRTPLSMPDAERSLSGMLCERYAVAHADSHIIEPADLWTSRIDPKWAT